LFNTEDILPAPDLVAIQYHHRFTMHIYILQNHRADPGRQQNLE